MKPGGKSKHHKKNSDSNGHKRQRERRPSGSSVSSLSTECSRVSSQGGSGQRHRDRHNREHGSSKRRKVQQQQQQQQQPEESSENVTLRLSSQVSIHTIKYTQILITTCWRVFSSRSAHTNSRRTPEIQLKPTDHIIQNTLTHNLVICFI